MSYLRKVAEWWVCSRESEAGCWKETRS